MVYGALCHCCTLFGVVPQGNDLDSAQGPLFVSPIGLAVFTDSHGRPGFEMVVPEVSSR